MPETLTPVRLLRTSPALARLLASLFVHRLGGAMTTVGLPLFVVHHYGLGLSTGLALGLRLLPNILLGVFVGNLVDRFQPRRVAMSTALASAVLVAAIPATTALWQLQALSFLGGVVYMFGMPARLALRPLVMPAGAETAANSALVTTDRLAGLLGPACAGPVIAVAGLGWLFGVEALAAVLAAVLMLGLPDRPAEQRPPAPERSLPARTVAVLTEGTAALLMIVRRDRMLLGLTVTAFTYVAAVAIGGVFLATYSLETFAGIAGGNGYLLAAMGAGGVAGSLAASRLGLLHQGRLYFWGNVLEALCWLALPVTPFFPGALLLIFLAGFFESVATVVYFAEAQKRLPVAYTGRFYGIFIPLTDVFVMAGTTVGPAVLGGWGVTPTAVLISLLVAAPVAACASIFLAREVPAGAQPLELPPMK
jgi:ENTS family enterobactin (siderophore) exporter